MSLTTVQATVLTTTAEANHADGLGLLEQAADDHSFRLTGAGADTYDTLHPTAPPATGGRMSAAQHLRAEQAARTQVLAARRMRVDSARRAIATGDAPEQTPDRGQVDTTLAADEKAYTDLTGRDPYIGLLVTIPETGGHEWQVTARDTGYDTVELTSTLTGVRHVHWLPLDYVLFAADLAAEGLPHHPDRHVPATYLVERDDIGDGQYWEPVAKGDTTVAKISPIDLGIAAREIEQLYRAAGCSSVVYRVTVTCHDGEADLDRSVTALTPPPAEPCGCGECPPSRPTPAACAPAQHDDDPLAVVAADGDPDPSDTGPATPIAALPGGRTVHVWQRTRALGRPQVFVQLDSGTVCTTTGRAGRFERDAQDLVFGTTRLGPGRPGGETGLQLAASWTLVDGTTLHVDRSALCRQAADYIDPAPDGVDRDAWALARDMVDPTLRDQIVADLSGLLRALAVRLGCASLTVAVRDQDGREVFTHRLPS
jgi:hypothetical protein